MKRYVSVAITLALTGLVILPAAAHSQLVSALPADGATLAIPPTEVRFTFNENLVDGLTTLAIINDAGDVVISTSIAPKGTEVVLPWPADLGSGTWQVSYRVVSADGHPVSGAITFVIGAATPVAAEKAPSASDGSATLWFVGGVVLVVIIVISMMTWGSRKVREVRKSR